ncbi:MAG: TldD/PmbA family protein [Myxococcota bacterium]
MSDPLREALDAAIRVGATACDVSFVEQDRLAVEVRAGEIDKLTRAHDRVLSLRLFRGARVATVSSSDVTGEGIRRLTERARELADATETDPCVGLPDEAAQDDPSLDLYCDRTATLDAEEALYLARAIDLAARAHDPHVRPIGTAGVTTRSFERRLVRSDGFDRSYRGTGAMIQCTAVAERDSEKQMEFVYRTSPSLDRLPESGELGREAAQRVVRRLGARKIETQRLPVLYEPATAVSLLGHLGEALVGSAIDQGRSLLANRLGQIVATPDFELVDDGRCAGRDGTRPFDGEGVATRRTPLIEKGVLKSYLLDSYTARRLGLETTGNARRPLRGSPAPSHSNLFIEPGTEEPEAILARTERGLLVTDLLGFGFNPVTGDYSRGVAGQWIERGEISHAVQEVTVAGKLLEMLQSIDAVGSDLIFFGSIGAPTLRFSELTVAGV